MPEDFSGVPAVKCGLGCSLIRRAISASRLFSWCGLLMLLGLALSAGRAAEPADALVGSTNAPVQRRYRIMAVGDSITEGGAGFESYRYALWEKLFTAGYLVEYVGSRTNDSRIGPLRHEGYSGKNAEYLAARVPRNFEKYPADIVLIHAGHNHSTEEHPVPGIVAATERLIAELRRINPRVVILLAQVIPSGKLPKYEYLASLNEELGKLGRRLHSAAQPVIVVDQASGFDWARDTIADKVHPNHQGAEKIADHWFAALTQVLEKPPEVYLPKIVPYKQVGKTELNLHIFATPHQRGAPLRTAVVFFFGGGWQYGTPLQFYPECAHFAAEGVVAISADYRIAAVNHSSPFESVADGKSAIRWVRQHSAEWGIDPERIVAAGASAGGQVAAAAGTVPGLDETGEDVRISSRPNALLLWYAVVDNGPDGFGYSLVKDRFREISPLQHLGARTPPVLFFLGTKDTCIPLDTAREFEAQLKRAGVRCELEIFPGLGHPLYRYREGASPVREQTLAHADAFLKSLGMLPESPGH